MAKRTIPSAIGFAEDIISGENVGQSAKNRLIEAGKNGADETLDKIKTRLQGGRGRKRRKMNPNSLLNLVKSKNKKNLRKRDKKTKSKIKRNRFIF